MKMMQGIIKMLIGKMFLDMIIVFCGSVAMGVDKAGDNIGLLRMRP